MVLYNIIRLTLVTSLIIYLISPDVERRLSFALAFTAAFFLPASVSIPTTYHGDWQIAAVSELFRFLFQLAVCYLSVSYTHLDVYKRQLFTSSFASMGCISTIVT